MIKIITGTAGSGKTKKLVQSANEIAEKSNGFVVAIDKGEKLTHDFSHSVRFVDSDDYFIINYSILFGFLSGICAGNYDVTDIFVDNTFKICGKYLEEFTEFLKKINIMSRKHNVNFIFTVAADASELPENITAIAEID